MKTRVLDAWAVLAWINARRPAARVVAELLRQADLGRVRLLMSAVTAGEVHCVLRAHHSVTLAEDWRALSRTLPVTIEVPNAEDIWNAAAIKGQFAVSYADAFAAGLARKYACALLTGDRAYRAVAALDVHWLSGQ